MREVIFLGKVVREHKFHMYKIVWYLYRLQSDHQNNSAYHL